MQEIQDICRYAKARDAKALMALVDSGISIDIADVLDEPAVAVLASKTETQAAALFLVENFKASRWWLIYGLGRGNFPKLALEQIQNAPEKKRAELAVALVRGMGHSGFISEAVKLITSAAKEEKIELIINLAQGLGIGGHLHEGLDLIKIVPNYEKELRKHLAHGLAIAGKLELADSLVQTASLLEGAELRSHIISGLVKSGRIELALEQIKLAPAMEQADHQKIMMRNVGLSGNLAAEKSIMAKMPEESHINLRKEFMSGLGKAGFLNAVVDYVSTAPKSHQPELRKQLMQILGKRMRLIMAEQQISAAPENEKVALRQTFAFWFNRARVISKDETTLLEILSLTSDNELRKLIVINAKEKTPSLATDSLLVKANKIHQIKNRYQLESFNQAKVLLKEWKSIIPFFLHGPIQLVQPSKIYTSAILPFNLFVYISSFALGLSQRDTYNVFKAVHVRLKQSIDEKIEANYRLKKLSAEAATVAREANQTRYELRIKFESMEIKRSPRRASKS